MVEDAGCHSASSTSSCLSTSSSTLDEDDEDDHHEDDSHFASMRRDHPPSLSNSSMAPRRSHSHALSQSLGLSFNFDILAGEGLRRSVLVRNALLASSAEMLPKHAQQGGESGPPSPSTVTCDDYHYQDEEEEKQGVVHEAPRPYTEAEWFDDLLQELEDGIAGRDGEEAVKHQHTQHTQPLRIAVKDAREAVEEHHVSVCDSTDGYSLVWCDDEEEHMADSEPHDHVDLSSSEGLPALVPDSDEEDDEEDEVHHQLCDSTTSELSCDDDDVLATPGASHEGPLDFNMRSTSADYFSDDVSCPSSSSTPHLRSPVSSSGGSDEGDHHHVDSYDSRPLADPSGSRARWQPTLAMGASTDYWQRLMTGSATEAASAAYTLSCRPQDDHDHDAIVQSWQRPRNNSLGLSLQYGV